MKRARRWGAADPNGASVLRYGIAVFSLPPRPLHLEDRTKGESRDIYFYNAAKKSAILNAMLYFIYLECTYSVVVRGCTAGR